MPSIFVLDALTTWTAILAVSTIALAVATTALVVVGREAAKWARRTFGAQERDAIAKREPYLAIWIAAPAPLIAGNYSWSTDDQVAESIRWSGVLRSRPVAPVVFLPAMQLRLVCFVQNLGEGMAVSVRVPYRLTVKDVLEDRSLGGAQTYHGTFEIYHVGPGGLGGQGCTKHIELTYFPWWKLELLLDEVVVIGMRGVEFSAKDVLAETSKISPSMEMNNDVNWRVRLGLPNYGEPVRGSVEPGPSPR